MTPNFGQGACQAIEDAEAVAVCLTGASDLSAALKSYEASRRDRTAFVTNASRQVGAISQWENPLLCWLRNLIMRTGVARRPTLKQFERMLAYELPAPIN